MKVRIFTDGACSGNPGPGGYAFVIALSKQQYLHGGREEDTTNNRMELRAVISALQAVIKNADKLSKYDEIEIYSDSAYVVNSINQNWLEKWQRNGWKTRNDEDVKNSDLWRELLECRKSLRSIEKKVTFYKVKGHSGNTFNEMVDNLAQQMTKSKEGV